jgi:Ran GTPase-activating protein (RanGAP) involved in mRNA processing and transport
LKGIGADAIAGSLKSNSSVIELDLAGNSIGPEGTLSIAEMLKVNRFLKTVRLDRNGIGVEGAQYIGDALRVNSSLSSLFLGDNHLYVGGSRYIAEALKFNRSLLHLSLCGSMIGNEGVNCFAEALKFNASLQKLDISANNIVNLEGSQGIANLLRNNSHLESISLIGNSIDLGLELITDALSTNKSLVEMNFDTDGDIFANQISQALCRNQSRKNEISKFLICSFFARNSQKANKKLNFDKQILIHLIHPHFGTFSKQKYPKPKAKSKTNLKSLLSKFFQK